MTMLTWEGMHVWDGDRFVVHVFHLSNELAGYASVLHATALAGQTGAYGRPRRAAVIGFGSAGRGAVHALKGLGFSDITVFLDRDDRALARLAPTKRSIILQLLDVSPFGLLKAAHQRHFVSLMIGRRAAWRSPSLASRGASCNVLLRAASGPKRSSRATPSRWARPWRTSTSSPAASDRTRTRRWCSSPTRI